MSVPVGPGGPAHPQVPGNQGAPGTGERWEGSKEASEQWKVVTESLEGLVMSAEGLVSRAKEFPSPADSSSQASMEWNAEKMVHDSQRLLQIISSLKVSGVSNDIPAMNTRIDARNKELTVAEKARHQALVSLGLEVSGLLHELEASYYGSRV
mmetsp:Transcript_44884/g.70310  ORF Transcript_44884/g.70310 Transcript_44884/m.70310 type:complete len:153 (-) Transcript_44884:88-546(-)